MSIKVVKKTDITILSSRTRICKTERFIKETARFLDVDSFITHFAEAVIQDQSLFDKLASAKTPYYKFTTVDKEQVLYSAIVDNTSESAAFDIVFTGYEDKGDFKRKNDSSLVEYLAKSDVISFYIDQSQALDPKEFSKIYLLSGDDQVNFPLLNDEQLRIVTTENANVIASGVAGSGKTNICIDKIIYSAARGYLGKILYTTYSRGLLIDTESKVNLFKRNVKEFSDKLNAGKVVFVDEDKRRSVENKLGIFLNVNDRTSISVMLENLTTFLENNVDFKLLSDFDKGEVLADQDFFIKEFIIGQNRRLIGKLGKLPTLGYEIIYKEIYGMICGYAENIDDDRILTLDEYTLLREDSFGKRECELIYSIALDYLKFMETRKAYDNNTVSRKLIKDAKTIYSVAIIDEVQDFTQINLKYLTSVSRKTFAVGDALQMINPSYFGFAYLKRLLYFKDEISVKELTNNYRNSRSVADIVNDLSTINVKKFGLHNFVLKGKAVGDGEAKAVYFDDKDFIEKLRLAKLNNFTLVVSDRSVKNRLLGVLPRQEILTVSEIKGLERDTVLLYDLLSDNAERWREIEQMIVDRKTADENSVYRYYFNLFYVGLSRAKANLFVVEKNKFATFDGFFKKSFTIVDCDKGLELLLETVSKTDVDRDELLRRIDEFLRFGQYDNALYTANRLEDDLDRRNSLTAISIHQKYLANGDYRGAGIAYWEAGDIDSAKKMFELSGDKQLIDLVDRISGKGETKLGADIVGFYPELKGNAVACKLILDALTNDLNSLKTQLKENHKKLIGAGKNGKR